MAECPAGCGDTFKTERGAKQHVRLAKIHADVSLDDLTVDHDERWRPTDRRRLPTCGYTLRGDTCDKSGPHYCKPRADRVVLFFSELLVHPKGPLIRQPFRLRHWQEHEIVRPLFGEVVWSAEWGSYRRRFSLAYIVLARKNGKSALLSGIVLYLLVGDDEEAAHIYGAAKNTRQAGKVFEPTKRMAELSPKLNGFKARAQGRLGHHKNTRRLYDEQTASYYEIITRDPEGELGHDPHGFVLDEVLSQPDGSLWGALTSARGARLQALMLAITTETNRPYSFGADLIDEAERVQEDPSRAPHIFSFVRKIPKDDEQLDRLRRLFPGHPHLPVSTDPLDEDNWKWANPALDEFKSRESMREQAAEAADNPRKLNEFCQYQANQRMSAATRWIALDLYDDNIGEVALTPDWLDDKLAGRACTGGLDLSAKYDVTAWTLLFRDGQVLWRFWVPEAVVKPLDEETGGKFREWIAEGWVTATDGEVIDYDSIYDTIEADTEQFAVESITYDRWSGEPVRQEIEKRTGVEMFESATTYQRMTMPMKELMRQLKARELGHGANPVARWMADNLEVKSPTDDPDRLRPVKPDRSKSNLRIDGMVSLIMAIDGQLEPEEQESVYESRGIAL